MKLAFYFSGGMHIVSDRCCCFNVRKYGVGDLKFTIGWEGNIHAHMGRKLKGEEEME